MKTEINQMEAKKIKIILADNRTIVRTCISHLMNHHNANIQVIGKALDGWHLLKLVASIMRYCSVGCHYAGPQHSGYHQKPEIRIPQSLSIDLDQLFGYGLYHSMF